MPPMGGPMAPPAPMGMPPMPGMPGMGGPMMGGGMMGQPPEMALMMEAIAALGGPSAGEMISQAVTLLHRAREMDEKVAPVVSRAIDVLKGSCGETHEGEDDENSGSPTGPSRSPRPSDY